MYAPGPAGDRLDSAWFDAGYSLKEKAWAKPNVFVSLSWNKQFQRLTGSLEFHGLSSPSNNRCSRSSSARSSSCDGSKPVLAGKELFVTLKHGVPD
jgi:hypothetical protein